MRDPVSLRRDTAEKPRRFGGRFRHLMPVIMVLLLTACNTSDIFMDSAYNPKVTWGRHVVSSGETMYSIAMRYGWNYRELASANNISEPYQIRPGQVIRLDLEPSQAVARRSSQSAAPASSGRPSSSSGPSSTRQSGSSQASSSSRPSASSDNKSLQPRQAANSDVDWKWPHVGPIIAKFSPDGDMNKGVDIGGDEGDPINAAASGSVVYAGSGLLGYGKLIIVNHSDQYLSAYAHNRSILVNEGDRVNQGDQIAEMGDTGTNRVKLHFEIRKNGDPVDPLKYLPHR